MLEDVQRLAAWLPALAAQLSNRLPAAHKAFRLFMTTSASQVPALPKALVEMCFVYSADPPSTLKASLVATYREACELPEADESALPTTHAVQLRALILGLCMMHVMLMQRRRYGALGWNLHAPFNTYTLHHTICCARKLLHAHADQAAAAAGGGVLSSVMWGQLRAYVESAYYDSCLGDVMTGGCSGRPCTIAC